MRSPLCAAPECIDFKGASIRGARAYAISVAGILDGPFASASYDLLSVYDAGTEVNDFATSAGNPLFAGLPAGQGGPNEGAAQGGVVSAASGADYALYLNAGGFDVSVLNFTSYASLATITVEAVAAPVPIPTTAPLIAAAVAGLGLFRRRHAPL